jgi:glycerol-3-phosphate acyltransferase PlsY
MQTLIAVGVVLLAYIFGSIPFGLLIVKSTTGKDVREVESGRTGGTNVMRAAGFWAGMLTAILDALKGAAAVWVAQAIIPGDHLLHVLTPLAAILGHNHSIFLPEYDENGRFVRLRGGAGGATAVGGALGIWSPSVLVILPVTALIFFTLGIASVTTMSIALITIIVFAIRASQGLMPWVDVLYPILGEVLMILALRPNLQRLLAGNERVVKYSLYGKMRERRGKEENNK